MKEREKQIIEAILASVGLEPLKSPPPEQTRKVK